MTSVPVQYQSEVTTAAKTLGIPEAIVAAQIYLESGFNPRAVSPAGAEGIAQFMPATWSQYSSGDPFDPVAAFDAYTRYMADLLKQEGGDVRKALEAYNAGPGNLAAGASYATDILTNAGTGDTTATSSGGSTTTSSGSSGGGLLSIPSDITGFFSKATDDLTNTAAFFSAMTRVSTYIRLGAGIAGMAFLIISFVMFARETAQ